jgi:hypothetical protein
MTTKKKARTKRKPVVVPEVLTPEEMEVMVLQAAYHTPCKTVEDLAVKAGVSSTFVTTIIEEKGVDLVKLSNFRESFAPSLQMNIRNLLIRITALTAPGAQCDHFALQKYTQAMKTLNDMLKDIEGRKGGEGDVAKRTIKITEIIEEYHREPKLVN